MPELHFEVRWPDGESVTYYSPSTIIATYFAVGMRYAVREFVARASEALNHASERVRAKYGYACSSALDTLGQIEARAGHVDAPETDEVLVLSIRE